MSLANTLEKARLQIAIHDIVYKPGRQNKTLHLMLATLAAIDSAVTTYEEPHDTTTDRG